MYLPLLEKICKLKAHQGHPYRASTKYLLFWQSCSGQEDSHPRFLEYLNYWVVQ